MNDDYLKTLEKISVTIDGETMEIVGASFRGVPFFVDNYTQGGLGRNVVTKKIPKSDRCVREDMGSNIPTHTMNIYLVGDDCDVQRQKLVNACGSEGVAEFVHPWLGKFNARVSALSFTGNRAELGFVKGSITIEQESDAPDKSVNVSMKLKTIVDAKSTRQNATDKFVDVVAKIKKSRARAINEVNTASDMIADVLEFRKSMNEIQEFVNECGKLKASVNILLDAPNDFVQRFVNLMTTSAEVFGVDVDKRTEVDEFISLLSETEFDGDFATMVRDCASACLLENLVKCEFSSVDEASDYLTRITNLFDKLLGQTSDVLRFMDLCSLQSCALTYLQDTIANLAVVIEKNVPSTCNVLTFCFDTYNNLERVSEIMERNKLSQGLFITPGKVKVLSK